MRGADSAGSGRIGSGDENRPIVAECLLHVNNVNRPQELRLLYVKGKSESKDVPVGVN